MAKQTRPGKRRSSATVGARTKVPTGHEASERTRSSGAGTRERTRSSGAGTRERTRSSGAGTRKR